MSVQKTITPESLIQTRNGKKFFSYSGLKSVTSAGIDMLNIENVGDRDIECFLELANADNLGSDNPIIKIFMNEQIIFQDIANNTYQQYPQGYNEIRFIISAHSSLRVHMTINANTYNYNVMLTGNFLENE